MIHTDLRALSSGRTSWLFKHLVLVASLAPIIECLRVLCSAQIAVSIARAINAWAGDHSDAGNLAAAVAAVDRRMPGGPNCYRRALLMLALDSGASTKMLHMGLDVHGRFQGHAWLTGEIPPRPYEVELRL